MAVADLIAAHRAAGRDFEAAGVKSFALDQGDGPAIVLVHGVPTCSYLYRKIVPPLAADGFRAVAFDFRDWGSPSGPNSSTTRGAGSLAGWATRSTCSRSSAATSSSMTSEARSAASGRSATPSA